MLFSKIEDDMWAWMFAYIIGERKRRSTKVAKNNYAYIDI